MKTLLELAHQYKGDVEQRIICIENERSCSEAASIKEVADDYNAQIAHWEATLKQIDEVLAKYGEAIQIKLIAVIYEWVCPNCNDSNKGSGIGGDVVCNGCHKLLRLNFRTPPNAGTPAVIVERFTYAT